MVEYRQKNDGGNDMEKLCWIFCALEPGDIRLRKEPGDLVIAADRGYAHAKKAGIMPDLILGDFDSLGEVPPEDGVLEAVLWDVDTNYIFPEIAGDAAAAAEKAKAAFEAFRASLRGKDETYAYALWLNLQNQRGADFVLGNKVGDIRVVAKNQALAALASQLTAYFVD